MASTRARLLAAAILSGGIAGPLAAQAPGESAFAAQSFEVLPPRRLPLPAAASVYDSQNRTVGFFSTSLAPPMPQPPANAGAPTAPGSTNQLHAPRPVGNPNTAQQGVTVMPLFGRPPAQNQHQPLPAFGAPPLAPAWRWYGYGTVVSGNILQSVANIVPPTVANPGLVVPDPPAGTLTMPNIVPMPMPPGPGSPADSRIPGAIPSYQQSPIPMEAVPLSNTPNEPIWRPLSGRIGAVNPNDTGILRANVSPNVADDPTLARAVFIPAHTVEQPPPPEQIPPSTTEGPLVTLRSTIETICAGRGRDLEMFHRNPNRLLIRLKVSVASDAEKLAHLISKLPELALYHVTYEIAVAP
jgi:hypothetical protein